MLIGGLALGLLFQSVASLARPTIPVFIGLLLFVASFRIGPGGLKRARSQLGTHIQLTLLSQLLLPLLFIAVIATFGWSGIYVTALLLVVAAAPISGSPNLVIMLGHDPAAALRQLVVGTALLPLTLIPVLLFLPGMGSVLAVAIAATKLLVVILSAAVLGLLLRKHPRLEQLNERQIQQVDGISAILMALVVVGLMSAISDAFTRSPLQLLLLLVFAFAVNIGLQLLGCLVWGKYYGQEYDVPMSVISGNRNIALYLTALPAAVTEPLLAFVGCYQFPMYMTPLLMRRIYGGRGGKLE